MLAAITGYSPAYVWQVRDLAPGEGGVITISGSLSATLATGAFSNTATIGAMEGELDQGSNSSSVSITVSWLQAYLPLVLREKLGKRGPPSVPPAKRRGEDGLSSSQSAAVKADTCLCQA